MKKETREMKKEYREMKKEKIFFEKEKRTDRRKNMKGRIRIEREPRKSVSSGNSISNHH